MKKNVGYMSIRKDTTSKAKVKIEAMRCYVCNKMIVENSMIEFKLLRNLFRGKGVF